MKGVITLGLLLVLLSVEAQDAFVTQRFNTPLFVNPALTGNGEKINRLSFLYRDQWRSIPVPYVSAFINYDRKLIDKNNNRLGGGLEFFYDRSGDGALSTFHPTALLSYTRKFNEAKQAVSAGFNIGYYTQSIDAAKLQFDNQYDGSGFDPSLSSGEAFGTSTNFVSMGVGINFMTMMGERSHLDIGGAVQNPHEPDKGLYADGSDPQQMRYNAYATAELFMSPKWSITPSFHFQGQEKAKEYHASGYVSNYTRIKEMPFMWSLGGGYRVSDAAFAYAGVMFKDFLVGFSYDINSSDLAMATNNKGGFEITLRYEFEKRYVIDTIYPDIDTSDLVEIVEEEEIIEEVIEEEVIEPVIIEEVVIEEGPVIIEPSIEDVIKYIKEELAVVLFFDNDDPDPRTMKAETETDYMATFDNYMSRKAEYIEQIGAEQANAWFQVVRNSQESLDDLASELNGLMVRGAKIEVTLNGYASPIGSSEYNTLISMRRIQSVVLFLESYNDGMLKPYLDDGSIVIIKQLAGESSSAEDVNDDAANRKESVFSPAAAFERRVNVSTIREITIE